MAKITKEEFRQYIADKKRITLDALNVWLDGADLAIIPCACDDYTDCQGWQIAPKDDSQ